MQTNEIKEMIEEGIPDSYVLMEGDGTHFQAIVISDLFKGKTMIQQHQMVYKTLGDKVGADIHALSIKSYTQNEWDKQKGLQGL